MYWILFGVLGGFLLLLFAAGKEQPSAEVSVFMRPFYKVALYFYKRVSTRFPRMFSSLQVETDLIQLHPAEAREGLKTDYYVKKMALCLALAVTGTLIGGAIHLSVQGEVVLGEGGRVPRGSFRQGTTEITVAADFDGQEITVRVPVEFQRLNAEELNAVCQEFVEKLPTLILRSNENLQNVSTDLNLRSSYEGYPFQVEWDSSNPWAVSGSGTVFAGEQPQRVILSAQLTYEEFRRTVELAVTVKQPELTEEECVHRELEKLVLTAEESSREQESFTLPNQWHGKTIHWRQVVEDNSFLIWLMAVAVSVAAYFLFDRDLHGKLEQRKRALRCAYPELVHKLVLFVGAGMTVRGALQKLAGDYTAKRQAGAKVSPAYEELLYTGRELHSGISEGAAYEHFGKRTGMQEYIRLCTLLTQNLKRGNSSLLERLREEADKISEERLQRSRKLGEEAGTKLLVPMVMMLAVVMVMIMIPAFAAM